MGGLPPLLQFPLHSAGHDRTMRDGVRHATQPVANVHRSDEPHTQMCIQPGCSHMSHRAKLLIPALLALTAGVCAQDAHKPQLGIGFLWTRQSQGVVGKLTSEKDFVDVILGPGKLDVFQSVKPPVRVACIARSLERHSVRPFPGIRETIETLRNAEIPSERVIIAYNPERLPGTPTQEMDDLVESARQAREMTRAYGAPLLIGPGLREMQRREELYPELAKHCDIWMIQSQRLQLDLATRKPVEPTEYRAKVKRIADALRRGNPEIRIFVQVVTTAERRRINLTAEQICAYARAVEDFVDAVRIYGGSGELLGQIIDCLRPTQRKSTE